MKVYESPIKLIPGKPWYEYQEPSFRELEERNDKVLKQYLICGSGWSQYAQGICGISHYTSFYARPDGTPFRTKGEIKLFLKEHGLKNKRIKGKRSEYGEVGGSYYGYEAITLLEAKKSVDASYAIYSAYSISDINELIAE